MDANLEFLNLIYQNAQMGVESMEELITKAEDTTFKSLLEKQRDFYKEVHQEAGYLIGEVHAVPKGIGDFQNMSIHWMTKMKIMNDASASHMAEMLIQGTTMGIVKLREHLNNYTVEEVSKTTLDLARKLMKAEEDQLEELKKYL